jgi:hypothetical protein
LSGLSSGGKARHEDERDEDGGDDDQLTAFHGRIIDARRTSHLALSDAPPHDSHHRTSHAGVP